jgi:16S rRNA (cytosine967-C5)-methyltransferase
MTNMPNPRELALDILMETEKDGAMSHLVIRQMLRKYQYLPKQDRSFITRLAEGTLENRLYIDTIIEQFSKTPLKKIKPFIKNDLRMGIYQILWLDRVPDSAACNEAVKLAAKRGFATLKGYVNGVLRSVARQKESLLPENLKDKYSEDMETYLSLRYSVPVWIIKDWKKSYAYDTIESVLEGMSEPMPVTIRLQDEEVRAQEILDSLAQQGCTVVPLETLPQLYYLSGYDYLESLQAFINGWIMVQDASSVLTGLVASPAEGSFVLDLCAAPGGKSIHMAHLMHGTGLVEARDVSWQKVAYIEENIARMHMTNMQVKVWDATVYDESVREKADLVLCDVPCSGLGVMGNKTDIKYHMTPDKQAELVTLQKQILKQAVSYIKPGGYLVYSTCTIHKEENEDMFHWLLKEYGLKPVSIEKELAALPECNTAKDGYQQLLPGVHKTAGFFISKLQKVT